MINKCPVCKKHFDVLWPHLWAYKTEKGRYYCSWKCLRASEKKGEPKHMGNKKLLSADQCNHAVQLAINGHDPRPYLEECGSKNPQVAWSQIRTALKESNPETYAKLPRVIGHKRRPKIETPEHGSIPMPPVDVQPATAAEAMEGMKAAADEFFSKCEEMGLKLDKEPAPTEFEMAKKITGLMVEIGDFHYYPRTEYVDWTPVGHTEIVSLNTDEWKQVIRDLPEVLRELGAIK